MRIQKICRFVGGHFMLVAVLLGLAVSILATFTSYSPAMAAGTATWVDTTHLSYNGATYTEVSSQSDSSELSFYLTPQSLNCSFIVVGTLGSTNSYQDTTSATAHAPGATGCRSATSTTITLVDGSGNPETYNQLVANGGTGTGGGTGGTGGSTDNTTDPSCPIDEGTQLKWILCPIYILGTGTLGKLNGIIENFLYVPTEDIFGRNTATQATTCTTDPNTQQTTCRATAGTADLKHAFNVFRNIALASLAISALFMVASQVAGLDIFAAYTVRKALPRLIIAIIGVSLAWPILEIAVTFFNDLGTWVGQILLSVTQVSTGSGSATGSVTDNLGNIGSGLIGLLMVTGGGLLILGWGGLLSFILTFILASIVALIVLAIRQLVILVCILMAPLAIAASVMPGTQKLWHFWKDTLIASLVMFPIIMGFLAAGAAFAGIAGAAGAAARDNGTGAGISWDILALCAYFVPYLLLPFAFRLASGLMGTIFGMVNDRNKGWFDKLSNYRQGKTAGNWQDFKAGQRWRNNNNLLTKPANAVGKKIGQFMSSENKLGYFDPRKDRRAAVRADDESRWATIVAAEQTKKQNVDATKHNTDKLLAQSFANPGEARAKLAADEGWLIRDASGNVGTTYGAKAKLNKDTGKYMELDQNGNMTGREVSSNQLQADTGRIERAIAAARDGGGFGFGVQQYAVDQLAANGDYEDLPAVTRAIARASAGNEGLMQSHVGSARPALERAGLGHMKAGQQDMVDLVKLQSEGRATRADYDKTVVKAVKDMDNVSVARIKPKGMKETIDSLTRDLKQNLNLAATSADPNERAKASQEAGEVYAKIQNLSNVVKTNYASENAQATVEDKIGSEGYVKLQNSINDALRLVPAPMTNTQGQPLPTTVNAIIQPPAPQPTQMQAPQGQGQGQAGQPQVVWTQRQGMQVGIQPGRPIENLAGQPIRTQPQPEQPMQPANRQFYEGHRHMTKTPQVGEDPQTRFPQPPEE